MLTFGKCFVNCTCTFPTRFAHVNAVAKGFHKGNPSISRPVIHRLRTLKGQQHEIKKASVFFFMNRPHMAPDLSTKILFELGYEFAEILVFEGKKNSARILFLCPAGLHTTLTRVMQIF